MRIVYQTNARGEYVGEVQADESPLEPGVYLIPRGCVEQAPPAAPPGKIAVWQGSWALLNVPEPELDEEVPVSDEDRLTHERAQMRLSFAQFLMGLVEQGWISTAEHGAWLSGSGLPAAVAAALATIPETAPDGTMPRLRAQTRALRPSVVERGNDLLALMAHLRGATPEQLDDFFRVYAAV